MKIGIVTEFYYPTLGGIQEHVHHFALHARERDHDVQIITSEVTDVPAERSDARLTVTRVGRSYPFFANGSVGRMTLGRSVGDKLEDIFDRERFDVIHVHSPLTPVLPLLAVARSNALTIGTFHTNYARMPLSPLWSKLGQRYVDRLDGVIGVSKTAVAANQRYFAADYAVIPNGVDTSQFNPSVAPAFVRRGPTLLWVGRMEPRNGLDRMIGAFTLASARRADLSLLVVGDGPLRARYEDMIAPRLRSRVRFVGAVNAGRPAIYASADILCAPTTISSFGITLLEGMAAGLPLIASDIDGFRDVMTHEREGLLIDSADALAFRDAILCLVEDRVLAASYARRARATAERYAWARVADDVLEFYRSTAERRAC
jgi:phosphatidylinositol alpha-mannosyltransferase